jgi:hypothetical protein
MAYPISQLTIDLAAVLVPRPVGPLSGRALGSAPNLAAWAEPDILSLHEGLITAQASLYPEFELPEFARVVLCVAAQESTGDYTLHVPGGVSQGLMQVSPASVLADYAAHGEPLPPVAEPAGARRVSDPGYSVVMWAWYTRAVAMGGVSIAEYVHREAWGITTGARPRTMRRAMLAWLAGPAARELDAGVREKFSDYLARIGDYWCAAGFGDEDALERLLSRPLTGGVAFVREEEVSPNPDAAEPAVETPTAARRAAATEPANVRERAERRRRSKRRERV